MAVVVVVCVYMSVDSFSSGGGPPTSTWRRTDMQFYGRDNQILGNMGNPNVMDANKISYFISVLTMIAVLRHVFWFWESPVTSVFWEAPWWTQLFNELREADYPEVVDTSFLMQVWGGTAILPSRVIGTLPNLCSLGNPAPTYMLKFQRGDHEHEDGKAYPWGFCLQIYNLLADIKHDNGHMM
jgi:hypothetical protein